MILDSQTLFSDAQAITGTAVSTNVVQIGHLTNTPGDMGAGGPIPLLIQVVEAFDNLTNLVVTVEVDADAAFSDTKIVTSVTVLLADLVVGKQIAPQYVPFGTKEAFMRIKYTVGGSSPSAGKITAGISKGNQTNV